MSVYVILNLLNELKLGQFVLKILSENEILA